MTHAFDFAMKSGSKAVQAFGIVLASRIGPLLRGEVEPPESSIEELGVFAAMIEEDREGGVQ